jgi:LAS superfamily LD-carboxypeptidase LdcB
MKLIRSVAFVICFIFVSTFSIQAAAAGDETLDALKTYASELSQHTGQKYYRSENTQRYIDYKTAFPEETWENVITYVNIGLDQPFYTNTITVVNPEDTWVMVNKYRALPSDYVPKQLETVKSMYSYGTQKLRREARIAFEKMCADAKANGYHIMATSSYRSYERQAEIYASFFNPDDPSSSEQDLLAAWPGFSEHQTGLAVDFSRVDASVKSADVNNWIAKNSYKYGFILRYPPGKESVTGYANEPWHLRYLGVKLATAVYKSKLTYDEYYMRELDIPAVCTDTRAVGVTAVSNITLTGAPAPDAAAGETAANTLQLAAYEVLGARYFKLRDIAVILNGSPAQFDIFWDAATSRIELLKGAVYSGDPTLVSFEPGRAALVTAAAPGLLMEGAVYDLPAYSSGGSNYFKLEDILGLLGVAFFDDGQGNYVVNTAVIPPGPDPIETPTETPPAPAA